MTFVNTQKAVIGTASVPIKSLFPSVGEGKTVSVALTYNDPKNGIVQKGRVLMKCTLRSTEGSSTPSSSKTPFDTFLSNGKVKAFGITSYGDADQLQELLIPFVPLTGRQLRVFIKAVSVNPVDAKLRSGAIPGPIPAGGLVLGFDGAGIVIEAGLEATLFKENDHVMFSGVINKTGTNASLAIVDERIVGRLPKELSFNQAAALPLTSLTAWEALFEQLGLVAFGFKNKGKRILVLPGNGGVGSMVIQLAKKLLGLYVIATVSTLPGLECLNFGKNLSFSNCFMANY
jgi:D-arabinose 1-dehydrogenase-like Zn-dependent alcohol dehydrogenase